MKKNYSWPNLEKGANYIVNPISRQTQKIVGVQNFHNTNVAALEAAGITHLWSTRAAEAGILESEIRYAHFISTSHFGSTSPTEAKVRSVAREFGIYDDLLIIDEFFEGQYPQYQNATRTIFYDEIKKMATEQSKNVRSFGAYGYEDVKVHSGWDIHKYQSRAPNNAYFTDIMKPNPENYLTGWGTYAKNLYQSGDFNKRGGVIGNYYSFGSDTNRGDYFTSMFLNAMLYYQMSNIELIGVQWSKMQDNDSPFETWHGNISNSFPTTPYEIRKAASFLEQLLLEGSYDWNDRNFYINGEVGEGVGIDGWFAGIHLYADLLPKIQQAGGELVCCDFTVDGQRFSYTGSERRISRKGVRYFNNTYFNKVAYEKTYFALVIPSTEPEIILLDGYGTPLRSKNVVVHYGGQDFNCGNVPGMTLHVS